MFKLGATDTDPSGHRNINVRKHATGNYQATNVFVMQTDETTPVVIAGQIKLAPDGDGNRAVIYNASGTTASDVKYELDVVTGSVTILDDIQIATSGNQLEVTYTPTASTYRRITSGTQPVEGAMMFLEDNPKGEDNQWVFTKVTVRPNGDMALIGDEWRTIPLSLSIEKPADAEAIYINGTVFG